MLTNRRDFVKTLTAGGMIASGLRAQSVGGQSPAHIEVLPGEPIGTIAPDIYGHFIEHLGGVIYDGVWVGEGSKIPNDGGIRKAYIDAMKSIKAPNVRWPGGCFADSYDWRDGIGKQAERKVRANLWGGSETNAFGTQEFLRSCDLIGAKPYLAANVRSLPARDFYQWVEYCNSPAGSSDGAKQRAAQGHPEPYNVKWWGVGNESWGCGGNFSPEEYAAEYRRFVAWVPGYGQQLSFVLSGPSDHDLDWTRRLLKSVADRHQIGSAAGLSVHYYTTNLSGGTTTDWDKSKRDAVKFTEMEWYELLAQGSEMDPILRDHWVVAAESDPHHHIKLVVDEWGAWYKPGSEVNPRFTIGQMPTLRDALLTGLTFDIFHRHADKVAMANVAQTVNALHSLMLADEDKFVLTPIYHAFKMYMAHMGAQSVRTEFGAPSISYDRNGKQATLWGLRGSASVSGKNLTLTVVNPHPSRPMETEIVVRGASISGGSGQVLTNTDIHAHNTFQNRDVVHPEPISVSPSGGRLVHQFAPASVTALALTLS